MNVLLVGAGRMGMRHLKGLRAAGASVVVVDPRPEARAAATADGAVAVESLADGLALGAVDAAVLAATAAGRLELLEEVAAAGVAAVLLEKPVEQSRERVRRLARVAAEVDVRVNHWFRTLELFARLREAGGPFRVVVTGGAFGLACNGIHWLDLLLFLSGDRGGELIWGELDETPIRSGRGPDFRDYGGRAVFGFPDVSRLFLESSAASSAPMHAVVVQPDRETLLLPHEETAVLHERAADVDLPAYRYGAGYTRRETPALEGEHLWRSTERWAQAVAAGAPPALPGLTASLVAHDLLFDLLELSGDAHFPVT